MKVCMHALAFPGWHTCECKPCSINSAAACEPRGHSADAEHEAQPQLRGQLSALGAAEQPRPHLSSQEGSLRSTCPGSAPGSSRRSSFTTSTMPSASRNLHQGLALNALCDAHNSQVQDSAAAGEPSPPLL